MAKPNRFHGNISVLPWSGQHQLNLVITQFSNGFDSLQMHAVNLSTYSIGHELSQLVPNKMCLISKARLCYNRHGGRHNLGLRAQIVLKTRHTPVVS